MAWGHDLKLCRISHLDAMAKYPFLPMWSLFDGSSRNVERQNMIVEDMIRVWSRSSFSLALSDASPGGDSKGDVMARFSSIWVILVPWMSHDCS